MELKDALTLAIAAIGTMVAAFAALKALAEYRWQGITKRSEIFLNMRTRLREDASFKNICELLEKDDPHLRDIPLIEKDRFLGFFEELALLRNSGFVNDRVVFYMFGYYAVRCVESKYFWRGLYARQDVWVVFRDFAKQMQETERAFEYDPREFRL